MCSATMVEHPCPDIVEKYGEFLNEWDKAVYLGHLEDAVKRHEVLSNYVEGLDPLTQSQLADVSKVLPAWTPERLMRLDLRFNALKCHQGTWLGWVERTRHCHQSPESETSREALISAARDLVYRLPPSKEERMSLWCFCAHAPVPATASSSSSLAGPTLAASSSTSSALPLAPAPTPALDNSPTAGRGPRVVSAMAEEIVDKAALQGPTASSAHSDSTVPDVTDEGTAIRGPASRLASASGSRGGGSAGDADTTDGVPPAAVAAAAAGAAAGAAGAAGSTSGAEASSDESKVAEVAAPPLQPAAGDSIDVGGSSPKAAVCALSEDLAARPAAPMERERTSMVSASEKELEEIKLDVERTPHLGEGQAGILMRVLQAHCHKQAAGGAPTSEGQGHYVQGMHLLAACPLWAGLDEAAALAVFEHTLNTLCVGYYADVAFSAFQRDVRVADALLSEQLPRLHAALRNAGISTMMLTFDSLLCLYTRNMPLQSVLRLWDVLLLEGDVAVFAVLLALLENLLPADSPRDKWAAYPFVERVREHSNEENVEDILSRAKVRLDAGAPGSFAKRVTRLREKSSKSWSSGKTSHVKKKSRAKAKRVRNLEPSATEWLNEALTHFRGWWEGETPQQQQQRRRLDRQQQERQEQQQQQQQQQQDQQQQPSLAATTSSSALSPSHATALAVASAASPIARAQSAPLAKRETSSELDDMEEDSTVLSSARPSTTSFDSSIDFVSHDGLVHEGFHEDRIKDNIIQLANQGETVDAQYIPQQTTYLPVAFATYPIECTMTLSEEYIPGQPVIIRGPHGRMEVQPPQDATAGSTIKYRLGPRPDFEIRVPHGAGPGTEVMFTRHDGIQVCVTVPDGIMPGQTFGVNPPAVMVLVPEGVEPGELVMFQQPGGESAPWCRAQVPPAIRPGRYFAARLPPPKALAGEPPEPQSSGWLSDLFQGF